MKYYLALGTNLGNRIANINTVLELLKKAGHTEMISSIYKTSPVGMEGNPPDFYNLCIKFDSDLKPENLMDELKKIEQQMGRDIINGHNLSRIIDIDIVIAEGYTTETKRLTLPHKDMQNRLFVLLPLQDLIPDLTHPVLGIDISEMIARLRKSGQTIELINQIT